MSHGGMSENGSAPHPIFIWDTKGNFQSHGYSVRNSLCHIEKYAKMDSPRIKSSCQTQNEMSNPMRTGIGIDYVTWRSVQKWIPSTLNLHVAHKMKFPILWV